MIYYISLMTSSNKCHFKIPKTNGISHIWWRILHVPWTQMSLIMSHVNHTRNSLVSTLMEIRQIKATLNDVYGIFIMQRLEWQAYGGYLVNYFQRAFLFMILSTPRVTCANDIFYIFSGNPITLGMRGPGYLGLTRSISWLLMPWLLASPGYQQPWYRLCKISKSWSYTRKDFNYLWHVNVEEWHKM